MKKTKFIDIIYFKV